METHISPAAHDAPQWVYAAASAARFTARKRRLAPADAEDLRSEMWLKLLRNDKAALRQFGGRSSLETFLTTVADRCALDHRVRQFGKWRPTRAARSIGTSAVMIERLTVRDGLPVDEAVEIVRAKGEAVEQAVRHLETTTPRTPVRPRFIPLDETTRVPRDLRTPEAIWSAAEAQRAGAPIRQALNACLRLLPVDELHLLKRRFLDNEQVAEIARADGRDQKALYRTIEKTCRRLRDGLAALGISREDACAILGSAGEPLANVLADINGTTGAPSLPR